LFHFERHKLLPLATSSFIKAGGSSDPGFFVSANTPYTDWGSESQNRLIQKIPNETLNFWGFNFVLTFLVYHGCRQVLLARSSKGVPMVARLRRKQASAYLLEKHGIPRAPGTLAKLATIGGGPPFSHVGKIPLYDPNDLDEWALSVLSGPVRSTSERAAKAPAVVKPPEEPAGLINTGFAEFAATLVSKPNDTS
jgi:hypothetical protein